MVASFGVIICAAYMLWLYKRVVFGEIKNKNLSTMKDLDLTEIVILSSLAILIIFFGFYPEPIINTVEVSVQNVLDMYNNNLEND